MKDLLRRERGGVGGLAIGEEESLKWEGKRNLLEG